MPAPMLNYHRMNIRIGIVSIGSRFRKWYVPILCALFAVQGYSKPALATGFTDLASCFTARKGDNKPVSEMGVCRLHFYSSAGGGTTIDMRWNNGFKLTGQCPGSSANYGLNGCVVNGLPGEIRIVGEEDNPAFCAWRHKDPIAYCARPWNHRGI